MIDIREDRHEFLRLVETVFPADYLKYTYSLNRSGPGRCNTRSVFKLRKAGVNSMSYFFEISSEYG